MHARTHTYTNSLIKLGLDVLCAPNETAADVDSPTDLESTSANWSCNRHSSESQSHTKHTLEKVTRIPWIMLKANIRAECFCVRERLDDSPWRWRRTRHCWINRNCIMSRACLSFVVGTFSSTLFCVLSCVCVLFICTSLCDGRGAIAARPYAYPHDMMMACFARISLLQTTHTHTWPENPLKHIVGWRWRWLLWWLAEHLWSNLKRFMYRNVMSCKRKKLHLRWNSNTTANNKSFSINLLENISKDVWNGTNYSGLDKIHIIL